MSAWDGARRTAQRIAFMCAALASAARAAPVQAIPVFWVSNVSGDWHNPSNWNPPNVPGPADDVFIDVPTNPIVTISQGSQHINSLDSMERIDVTGAVTGLRVDTTALFAQDIRVSGGTLAFGTWSATAPDAQILVTQSTTFTGMTLGAGTILTVNAGAQLQINSGLTLQNTIIALGADEVLPLDRRGASTATLLFNQAFGSLSGAGEIVFTGTSPTPHLVRQSSGGFTTLTIPPGLVIRTDTASGIVGANMFDFANQGSIFSVIPGQSIILEGSNITNSGSIAGDVALETSGNFSNAGSISATGSVIVDGTYFNTGMSTLSLGAMHNIGSLSNTGTGVFALSGIGTFQISPPGTITNAGTLRKLLPGMGTIVSPLSSMGGTIDVDAGGQLDLNGPLDNAAGTTLTKTGPGTVFVNGGQNWGMNSTLDVTAGALRLNTNPSSPTLRAQVGSGGALNFAAPASSVGSVTVNAGGTTAIMPAGNRVLVTRDLTIDIMAPTPTQLDMTDNAMIIEYLARTSPLPTVSNYVRQGYDKGSWTGNGIITSTAGLLGGNHGIGFAESSAIFSSFPAVFFGQQVDSTALLLRYTRYGDADLNGIVNLADFNRLAANFGITNAVWSQADFNYDQFVNLADFNLLASNFGFSASPDGPTPRDWALLASVVPEPSFAVGLLTLACGATLRRAGRLL